MFSLGLIYRPTDFGQSSDSTPIVCQIDENIWVIDPQDGSYWPAYPETEISEMEVEEQVAETETVDDVLQAARELIRVGVRRTCLSL